MTYNNDRPNLHKRFPKITIALITLAFLTLPVLSLHASTLSYICSDKNTVYKDSPLIINFSKQQAGWGKYINPILYSNNKHVMWGNAFSTGIQSYVFNIETGVLLQRFLDTSETSNKKLWNHFSKYRCVKSGNA